MKRYKMFLTIKDNSERVKMKNLNVEMLDCTLRDGGYVNNWRFSGDFITEITNALIESGIENIECGYFVKEKKDDIYGALFNDLDLSKNKHNFKHSKSNFFAMIDVAQVKPNDIPLYNGQLINTLRVVFYKHQIDIALPLIKDILDKGFKVFVQPMVTIDYSEDDFIELLTKIDSRISAVSIVDSFGNITKEEILKYLDILNKTLNLSIGIGIHLHDNLEKSVLLLNSFLEQAALIKCERKLFIDSSLGGMGRGAGNLKTEVLAEFLNTLYSTEKYNIFSLLNCVDKHILPLKNMHFWGSDPFSKITSILNVHPNYAKFIRIIDPNISVEQFVEFIKNMPEKYRTLCRLEITRELYEGVINK